MKARLLHYQNSIQLLFCTGRIQNVSLSDACDFLLDYDNPKHYSDESVWDFENLTMESYHGATIAYVDDDGRLIITDANWYREIIDNKKIELLTAPEYAALHGKQSAIVRRLCQNGRLEGAFLKGNTWLIPAKSPYPQDERFK